MARKTPYTEIGIRRLKCIRCGKPAKYQWNACSDDNIWRPLCTECDIEINKLVLQFMGFPDWEEKIIKYSKKLRDCEVIENG
jgi:NAD-dependent SIR2 family protein deacetylase